MGIFSRIIAIHVAGNTQIYLCAIHVHSLGNSPSRKMVKRAYPRNPTDNHSLEAQQRALIAAQEDMLRRINIGQNGNHINLPFPRKYAVHHLQIHVPQNLSGKKKILSTSMNI